MANNTASAVNYLFQTLLGRAPDEGGLNFYVNELNSGAMSLRDMAYEMAQSAEARDKGLGFYSNPALNDPAQADRWLQGTIAPARQFMEARTLEGTTNPLAAGYENRTSPYRKVGTESEGLISVWDAPDGQQLKTWSWETPFLGENGVRGVVVDKSKIPNQNFKGEQDYDYSYSQLAPGLLDAIQKSYDPNLRSDVFSADGKLVTGYNNPDNMIADWAMSVPEGYDIPGFDTADPENPGVRQYYQSGSWTAPREEEDNGFLGALGGLLPMAAMLIPGVGPALTSALGTFGSGALLGGVGSALSGGDPLRGALLGGAGSWVGGQLFGGAEGLTQAEFDTALEALQDGVASGAIPTDAAMDAMRAINDMASGGTWANAIGSGTGFDELVRSVDSVFDASGMGGADVGGWGDPSLSLDRIGDSSIGPALQDSITSTTPTTPAIPDVDPTTVVDTPAAPAPPAAVPSNTPNIGSAADALAAEVKRDIEFGFSVEDVAKSLAGLGDAEQITNILTAAGVAAVPALAAATAALDTAGGLSSLVKTATSAATGASSLKKMLTDLGLDETIADFIASKEGAMTATGVLGILAALTKEPSTSTQTTSVTESTDRPKWFKDITQSLGETIAGEDNSWSNLNNYITRGTREFSDLSDAELDKYINPYTQRVLNPQLERMGEEFTLNENRRRANLAKTGAFGGSRDILEGSLAQERLDKAKNEATANAYSNAFNTGATLFGQDRTANQWGAGALTNIYGALKPDTTTSKTATSTITGTNPNFWQELMNTTKDIFTIASPPVTSVNK